MQPSQEPPRTGKARQPVAIAEYSLVPAPKRGVTFAQPAAQGWGTAPQAGSYAEYAVKLGGSRTEAVAKLGKLRGSRRAGHRQEKHSQCKHRRAQAGPRARLPCPSGACTPCQPRRESPRCGLSKTSGSTLSPIL